LRDDGIGCAASIDGRPARMFEVRETLLLLSVSVLLLLWGLGNRGLWAAEGRWAEVTREMLMTGDFFHPTIDGEPYFDKPFLTYWFRVIISAATGILNEFVVRLPSAVAGLVAIWATVSLGTRLWSAKVGRLAGWFLLTTYAFLFWSRTGTAEAENLAFIVVAVAWYWSRRDHLGFPALLVFYLIVFVGALTKGLTAVVVPMVIVLPDMVTQRRWRLLLRPAHILALVMGLLVYLSPFVYASLTQGTDYQSSGLGLVFQENILRYFNPIDHKGPIYLYVYGLPVLLLPWTPLFVVAVVATVQGRKVLDRHTRWLISAIVLVFLFFTVSGSRRSYYILPILPLCALLMAVFVGWLHQPHAERLRQQGLGIQRAVFIGLIAFELAIPLILIVPRRMMGFEVSLGLDVASLAVGVLALIAGGIVMQLSCRSAVSDAAAWPLVAVVVVLLGGFFCWQQNILEANRTERAFARQLREETAPLPPERIAVYPKPNANLLFYLAPPRPLQILDAPEKISGSLEPACPGAVITQRRYATGLLTEFISELQRQKSLREPVYRWETKSSKEEKWIAWFWDGSSPAHVITKAHGGTNHAP